MGGGAQPVARCHRIAGSRWPIGLDRASDLGWATWVVQDGLVKPAVQVAPLSSQGDAITVHLVGAKGPSCDPEAVYYVERRGAYVLERAEEWPALPSKGAGLLGPVWSRPRGIGRMTRETVVTPRGFEPRLQP